MGDSQRIASPSSPRSRSDSMGGSGLAKSRSKSNLAIETNDGPESPGKLRKMLSFSKVTGPNGNPKSPGAGTEPAPSSPRAKPSSDSATGGTTKSSTSPLKALARAARAFNKEVKQAPTGKKSMLQRYKSERLPFLLGNLLALALIALTVALYYAPKGGMRLVRRDTPLKNGHVLKAGEYMNTCTGLLALASDCKPLHFEMSLDGELSLFNGKRPDPSRGTALWTSKTRVKNNPKPKKGAKVVTPPPLNMKAEYKDGVLVIKKDEKPVFKTPKKALPKVMQGKWPLA